LIISYMNERFTPLRIRLFGHFNKCMFVSCGRGWTPWILMDH